MLDEMHHGRYFLGADEWERRKLCAELRGEVFGCKYGGVETFGDDEGGDVVREWGREWGRECGNGGKGRKV